MDMDAFTNLLVSLVAGLAGVVLVLLRAEIKQIRVELNGFRAELNGFRAELNGFRVEMNSRFDAVIATQKQHGERLARLETLVASLIGPRGGEVPDPETVERAMVTLRAPGGDEADQP